MKKYWKKAGQAKKASCIILSACIAAVMVPSASVLVSQKICLKAETTELLQGQADSEGSGEQQDPLEPQSLMTGRKSTTYWNGESKTADCVQLDGAMTTLSSGWYAAEGTIAVSGPMVIQGEVHLILANNCNLTVDGGIQVSEGNSLEIYAESKDGDMGTLTATGGENAAGIGGGSGQSNGQITIFGGNVTAAGGKNAAGIGGGFGGNGSNITIHGGNIKAAAGTPKDDRSGVNGGGAGIGGGYNGAGSNICITGGIIRAEGASRYEYIEGGGINGPSVDSGGAGIGGGGNKSGSNIHITGGDIYAEGAYESGGAGIGGGRNSVGTIITIEAGKVTATGGGAGIGGGYAGGEEYRGKCYGSDITISGGTVEAKSVHDSAGIGGGSGIGGNIIISGGTVTATGGGFGGSAGIGGSSEAGVGNIQITGGARVTATGGDNPNGSRGGAGIGSGAGSDNHNNDNNDSGKITIDGSIVTAIGGTAAAGIGGGVHMTAVSISIKGSVVTAIAGGESGTGSPAGIGSGCDGEAASISIENAIVFAESIGYGHGYDSGKDFQPTLNGCIIYKGNTGTVHGKVDTSDFDKNIFDGYWEVGSDTELRIEENNSLFVSKDTLLYNNGTIINDGMMTLGNKDCLQGDGILKGNGNFFMAISTENFSQAELENLCLPYNGMDQKMEAFERVKKSVGSFTYEFGTISFKMSVNTAIEPEYSGEIRNAGTYDINYGGGTVSVEIQKARLKIEGVVPNGTSKPYNGDARIRIQSVEVSGKCGSDDVAVNTEDLYGSLLGRDVGEYYSVILSGLKLTGKDAGNYEIAYNDTDQNHNEIEIKLEKAFSITAVNTPGSNYTGSPGISLPDPYIQDPAVRLPFVKKQPSVSGWTKIRQQAAKAVSGAVFEIDMNGTSEVPKEMLQTVKDRNISLILDMEEGIGWELHGQDLTSELSGNIDFAVSCRTEGIPSELISLISSEAVGKPAYEIQKKQAIFGFPSTLILQTGAENAGFYANLYRIGGECKGAVKIGSDGTVRLPFTEDAEYRIILDSKSHMAPEENTEPQKISYEARIQTDGSIRITASDGSAAVNMLVTAVDGCTYYADAEGFAARNRIITADGKKYFAKETGEIAKNEFCKTPKGSLIYVRADRTLASGCVITFNGKKYYAKPSGAIARGGFFVTQKGSLIYARTSGEMITDQRFRVKGSLYYAKPSGALVRNGFYTTKDGDKIYAGSAGKLKAGKLFRVNGKLFYADKKGRVRTL